MGCGVDFPIIFQESLTPPLIQTWISQPPLMEDIFRIPSGYVKIAIENGPVEIVDFPIKNGDFP